MSDSPMVHWHEGLFLQPHHLQAQSRWAASAIGAERAILSPYSWGVVSAVLSGDALANRRVLFDELDVVLASGRRLRFPGDVDLQPLDIKPALESSSGGIVVSLALPLWQQRRANAAEVSATTGLAQEGVVYRVEEAQVFDENTGDNPQPLPVRKYNARLIVGESAPQGYEALPLVRVQLAGGASVGKPEVAYEYVPPCFCIGGSDRLTRLIRGIADKVGAARKDLVADVLAGGFSIDNLRPAQLGHVLKLRTLNAFAPAILALSQTRTAPPLAAYVEIRRLIGELAALQPLRDELNDAPPYRHDNLGVLFEDLDNRVRQLLVTTVRQTVWRVDFVPEAAVGTLAAVLSEEQLRTPVRYLLGVTFSGDPTALSRLVEDRDRFKLMSRRQIRNAVRGVALVEERNAPPELPRTNDGVYFRLESGADEASGRAWDDIQGAPERTIALKKPPADFPDAKFSLYMILPAAR